MEAKTTNNLKTDKANVLVGISVIGVVTACWLFCSPPIKK